MQPVNTLGSDPQLDESVWTTALSRIGALARSAVNEFVSVIQLICNPTQSPTSYEKCGLQVQAIQQDPSDYAKNITRDCCAVSGVAEIGNLAPSTPNRTGRVWGLYGEAGVAEGADGMAQALEIGLNNRGSEQPDLDTPTTKVVESVIAGEYPGDKNVTAARYVEGGTAKFFNGDIFNRTAFVSDASPVIGIRDQDGQLLGGFKADGTIQMRFVLSPKLPPMQPATALIWANTTEQAIYFVFFDGGNYFKVQLGI